MRSTYYIQCDVCNKDIIVHDHNTKYCPECKKIMIKIRQSAAHKKYEEKAKQEYEEKIIRSRNSNARIAAIDAEARKVGLTYGKYMSLKRRMEDTENE